MLKKHILALVFVSYCLLAFIQAEDRKVEISLNPACNISNCSQPNENGSYSSLLHVKLTGQNDAVHLMYSNLGSFSVMLFRTSPNAQLTIDWLNLLSGESALMLGSIKFNEQPLDTAGYEFPSVFEFDDRNGTADMTKTPANDFFEHKTSNWVWKEFKTQNDTSGVFEAFYPNLNGSFRFVLRYPGKEDRNTDLPHLLLNDQSSSIEFVIDSIEPRFNMSKFGLNVVYLTSLNQVQTSSKRTIDDEYTPGTFKIWNAEISDSSNSSVVRNFLQWKPVFYFSDPKSLENSTITRQYDLVEKSALSSGLGQVFFDSGVNFTAMNISYGLEGDEKDGYFYKQTNYSSWTFSVGLSRPPVEKMSIVVTVVIIVGFGLPAAVILIGLVVMIAKKLRGSRQSEFRPLD
jgi:hypothetical protein